MSNYREFSDAELVDILQSGGDVIGAFTVIYDRYQVPLVLHADRMLHDQDLAKDVVQDIFSKLFLQREEIHINTSLKSYLYTAVRHQVFNSIKHAKVKINYAADFFTYAKESGDLADEQVCLKELASVIEAEIVKMPPKMREVFEMSRKQFLSQKEIAKMLNLSENTVRNHIHAAIKKLRDNDLLRTSTLF